MTSHEPPVTTPGRPSGDEAREAVIVDQPFDGDGLYSLRATLAAHANRLGAPSRVVDRLLIVASELATNAVRHGGGSGRLRLWRDGTTVRCRVTDEGPGIPDSTIGYESPSPLATSGRGIWICRQLCEELIIDSHRRGTAVTAVLRLAIP
jgi:anti-sigma regulatory factor (Ser/Thr protein kinase)